MSVEQPNFEDISAKDKESPQISPDNQSRYFEIKNRLEIEESDKFKEAEQALFERYTGFDAEKSCNWEDPKWQMIEEARAAGDYEKFYEYYNESLSEGLPNPRSLLYDRIRTETGKAPEEAEEYKKSTEKENGYNIPPMVGKPPIAA